MPRFRYPTDPSLRRWKKAHQCERCGAVRMSLRATGTTYAPKVCADCHNAAQAALMSKLMRRAHRPRSNATS